MAHQLSLHFNHHTLHLDNRNLISHSNCRLPLHSLLNNTTTIHSTNQRIITSSSRNRHLGFLTPRVLQNQEVTNESEHQEQISEVSSKQEQEEVKELLVEQSIWIQMKEIVLFTGPAIGLWLCGPLMSLIDTAVVGQGSSIELAALGPATVFCDYLGYLFMFLSIATSNMVATALAKQGGSAASHICLAFHWISMWLGDATVHNVIWCDNARRFIEKD